MTRTHAHRLLRSLICIAVLVASTPVAAYDVTSEEGRRLNLLEYVAARDDLNADEKKRWDEAVRKRFAGKALNDGTDEGVSAAKSVISAGIFFNIEPEKVVEAAYRAYFDIARFVPPPLAINYHVLTLQGYQPKANPRQMAFNFPRYFDEELAVELVVWWDESLREGRISSLERNEVTGLLRDTRRLMRPMLLERLWQGAQLEAQLVATTGSQANDVRAALQDLRQDLERGFRKVGDNPHLLSAKKPYYDRYLLLCKELGQQPHAKPVVAAQAPPQRAGEEPPTKVPSLTEPPAKQDPEPLPKKRHVKRGGRPAAATIPAPLPGEPLLRPAAGWLGAVNRTIEGWLGTPYRWGGVTKKGVDCSGFVRQAYRESIDVELPRVARAQARTGRPAGRNDLSPGDLVFFDTLDRGHITHVGLYLGDGVFVHATTSKGVKRDKLKMRYYKRAYHSARRLIYQR